MRGARLSLAALVGVVLAVALCGAARADDEIVRDAQGHVVQRIDAEGLAIWYRYDAAGRLLEERRSDGRRVRPAEAPRTPDAAAR